MADTNKVKFGLSKCYYAEATIDANGEATYTTPVALPGAVSISLDPRGSLSPFRADNCDYWVGNNNQGYNGDLELAYIPDAFRKAILGDKEDASTGLQYEKVQADVKHFALLFEFLNDAKRTRHVLYNCVASRPSVASQTTDEEIEPQTETLSLTCGSIYVSDPDVAADVVKGKMTEGDTGYASFFTSVVQPTA